MKKHLIYVTLLIVGAACQPNSVKESMASDENQASVVVNKRLLTEVPISTKTICQAGNATNCGETVAQLRQKLINISPLPAPDYGQEPSIDWQQADKAYRQFISTHKNEPITSLFQQLYARVLLNQYGLGKSNHYDQITYYLDQMVASHSLDISTMTQTIEHLKGHVAELEYNQKLNAIIQITQEQKEYNTRLIAALQKQTNTARKGTTKGGLRPDFLVEAHKQMIEQAKKSDVSVHLNRLEAIQRSIEESNY
jgi:uncharacterized protein (DUF885 family)